MSMDNVTMKVTVVELASPVYAYRVRVRVQGIVYMVLPLRRGNAYTNGHTIVGGVTLESGGSLGSPPPSLFKFYTDTNVYLTNLTTVNIRYTYGRKRMVLPNEEATYLGTTRIRFDTPIPW